MEIEKKTFKQIKFNDLIERLKLNKKLSSQFNYWGQDNHQKIDIFIDTIENNRDQNFVYKTYPSCDENGKEDFDKHGLWQSAMGALEFMENKTPLSDYLYPEQN